MLKMCFFLSFSNPSDFFQSFLFNQLQTWTLDSKIVDSYFSHFLFLSQFSIQTCSYELRVVRSWIPTFLMPCSFQSLIPAFLMTFSFHSFPFRNLQIWTLDGKIVDSIFFSCHFPFQVSFQTAPRMNFGWVDVEEGAGRTTNTRLIPSIL